MSLTLGANVPEGTGGHWRSLKAWDRGARPAVPRTPSHYGTREVPETGPS